MIYARAIGLIPAATDEGFGTGHAAILDNKTGAVRTDVWPVEVKNACSMSLSAGSLLILTLDCSAGDYHVSGQIL